MKVINESPKTVTFVLNGKKIELKRKETADVEAKEFAAIKNLFPTLRTLTGEAEAPTVVVSAPQHIEKKEVKNAVKNKKSRK